MQSNQAQASHVQPTRTIVLTGGGSGGHITPVLSLARALKQKDPNCNIVYIGHKGDKFDSLQENFHDFDFVSFVNAGKFRRYHGESFWRRITDIKTIYFNIRDLFRVVGSIGKALRILSKVKPDVVFSKGGFVGVPVGIAAKIRRVPIVTHDSDVIPGLANKIIGRWAKIHATGMPAEFYNYPKNTIRYVGIPVNEHLKPVDKTSQNEFKKQLGIPSDHFLLLITGGSLGSQIINEKILKIAPEILVTSPKIHIIHITGQKNFDQLRRGYKNALKPETYKRLKVLDFTNELYKYTGAADLIISRAGATTLSEFAIQGKACLIIPSAFLTGGHQLKNAQGLLKLGAIEIDDENSSPEELLGKTIKLLADTKKRKILAENLHKTAKPNASSELAQILLNITKSNEK